jgi:hypothetical protein
MNEELEKLKAFVEAELKKLAYAIKQKLHPSSHDVVDGEVSVATSNLAAAFSATDKSADPVNESSSTAVGAQTQAPADETPPASLAASESPDGSKDAAPGEKPAEQETK